eukprot:6815569-Ditylum_brightwellii.AAC.1
MTWSSKRQAAVQISQFGTEFTALKKVVEEVTTLQYHMRSMGIMSVSLAYRVMREHNAYGM